MNVRGERIIVFGDSTSKHAADSSPEIWDVDQGSTRVSGQPGDLLASMLLEQGAEAVRVNARVGRSAHNFWGREDIQRLLSSDQAFAPTKVIVILGTNDIGLNLDIDRGDMIRIRDFYKGLGAEVWGVGPWAFPTDGLNQQATPVVDMMKDVFGSRFIDPRPITAVVGRAGDGVHFGADSARQTADGLAQLILAAISPKPWLVIGLGVLAAIGGVAAWGWWRRGKVTLPFGDTAGPESSDRTKLWRFAMPAGIWRLEKAVSADEAAQWLAIHQKDEPKVTFKLSKVKPRKDPPHDTSKRDAYTALERERQQIFQALNYAGNTDEQVHKYHAEIKELDAKIRALDGLKGISERCDPNLSREAFVRCTKRQQRALSDSQPELLGLDSKSKKPRPKKQKPADFDPDYVPPEMKFRDLMANAETATDIEIAEDFALQNGIKLRTLRALPLVPFDPDPTKPTSGVSWSIERQSLGKRPDATDKREAWAIDYDIVINGKHVKIEGNRSGIGWRRGTFEDVQREAAAEGLAITKAMKPIVARVRSGDDFVSEALVRKKAVDAMYDVGREDLKKRPDLYGLDGARRRPEQETRTTDGEPGSGPPSQGKLQIGRKSDDYKDLPWSKVVAEAKKEAKSAGGNKLFLSMHVKHAPNDHTPFAHVSWDPMDHKGAIAFARKLIDDKGAMYSSVEASAERPHGSWDRNPPKGHWTLASFEDDSLPDD